jgi:hypothetical protein
MWTCSQCSEEIEDQFDSCWNCGATQAGIAIQDFEVEEEDPPPTEIPLIHCNKCGYEGKELLTVYRPPWWLVPVGTGIALTGVGILGVIIYMFIRRNLKMPGCPKCGNTTGLKRFKGEPTLEAEALWAQAYLVDRQAAARENGQLATLLVIFIAIVSTFVWWITRRDY